MRYFLRAVFLLALVGVAWLGAGCGKTPSATDSGSSSSSAGAASAQNRIGIQGTKGSLLFPDGKNLPLPERLMLVASGVSVEQGAFSSKCRMVFPGETVVEVKGVARFTLGEYGLHMTQGKCTSEFRHIDKKRFDVKVPCAVLGVRGTKITFDLTPATGTVKLLEGKVEVIPDDPGVPPFFMAPGDTMLLTGSTVIPPAARPSGTPRKKGQGTSIPSDPSSGFDSGTNLLGSSGFVINE